MSISMSRTAGPAVCHGTLALLDSTTPGSAPQPSKGTTSQDIAACAMFAGYAVRRHVAAHARHITPPLGRPVGHGIVAGRRHAAEATERTRRAAIGPDNAPGIPDEPHTFGMRTLEATLNRWERAGKHQDIVAAYRDTMTEGDGLDSVAGTTRRVALYDAVVDAWRQDGTFDKVVRASMEVLKQGGAYEDTIQRFREGFYPHLDAAQAEKKFLADFADWDNMSPTDKRISFVWYMDPRRMLGDEPADRDSED
ncbi:hypothetical protein [Bordetella flabilis]|nr:hypothetical protein [Bordetella flabilis]